MGNTSINTGSVQVHRKVLAEVVCEALKEVDGVILQRHCLMRKTLGLFGVKTMPGIDINIDKNQELSIEVRIFIRYGCNISDMANLVQNAIREAIARTVDIKCEKINVNIQGIEGDKS